MISVVALAAALTLAGCAGDSIDGPDGPTPPAPPHPSPTLPSPDEVRAMDCAAIEGEVLRQLEALPHVTDASAQVDGTTCLNRAPGSGDMLPSPSFAVTVPAGITADQLADTHGSIHALHSAYILPIVDEPEIITIDVDGVMEVVWADAMTFDAATAQAMLDAAGPGRYLAARIFPTGEAFAERGFNAETSYFYLYVDGGGATDAAQMTTIMEEGWAAAGELAVALEASVTLVVADVLDVDPADHGINPGAGRAQFLVDITDEGAMPDAFGAIALRTLDLADQSELARSQVYLRNEQPYARLIPEPEFDDISADSQEILDDIVAQLQAAGYELDFIHTY